MPRHPKVPELLASGPFHQSLAKELGVTADMLSGSSWERLYPRVWKHRDYRLTAMDRLAAAKLAMPARAQLSHASRLQALGLNTGSSLPVHFTVAGDHHIALSGIFLHRTEVLPPTDSVGVSPTAAFIQYCAGARVIDALTTGDWLLANGHMTVSDLAELCHVQHWRPGARQALEVVDRLNPRSRSVKESETRALLRACGLPQPQVNAGIESDGEFVATADLLMAPWRLAIEYEGRQHALSTDQFQIDIQRYARMRSAGYEYVQVTQAMLSRPRALMLLIHSVLIRRGYAGPTPRFGTAWHSLFYPIAVAPRLRAVS